jgi:hypothetical protein
MKKTSATASFTWARVKPDVLVLMLANFSHFSGVKCLATKLLAERITGKGGVAG